MYCKLPQLIPPKNSFKIDQPNDFLQMGDYLIVGVHTDAEIEKHKGPPVFTQVPFQCICLLNYDGKRPYQQPSNNS